MKTPTSDATLNRRRAGVLLHPSSLPGHQHKGTIGQEAKNFLHFMKDSGLSVWQMLPLGPTHEDGSPYQCLSVHAGNPELIDLAWLVDQGWLSSDKIDSCSLQQCLTHACDHFFKHAERQWIERFYQFFERSNYWLEDYALYMALKQTYHNSSWTEWPLCYRYRDSNALAEASAEHARYIKTIQFGQFVFFSQWHELKNYARELNILLFGDMPIYVAPDSADVWSHKECFLMHKDGSCDYVAGVPPDYYAEEGQLWGNPLYDWDYLKKHDFDWWIARFQTQFELFDLIRLDHFRGLEACWHIPGDAETAVNGHWVKTPGQELLQTVHDHFDSLPLVAEDLGHITPEVMDLRDGFKLPGMAVLQFAFNGLPDNLYLPHNHLPNSVVYTGTHDNDTTLGWYRDDSNYSRQLLHDYMGRSADSDLDMPWDMIRMALSSVAYLAIIPMQDLLSLDSQHRMNTPGTTQGNWSWRFDWSQLWSSLPHDLHKLIRLYGRES